MMTFKGLNLDSLAEGQLVAPDVPESAPLTLKMLLTPKLQGWGLL